MSATVVGKGYKASRVDGCGVRNDPREHGKPLPIGFFRTRDCPKTHFNCKRQGAGDAEKARASR